MRAAVALVWIRGAEHGDESADGGHVVFAVGEPRVRVEVESAEEVKVEVHVGPRGDEGEALGERVKEFLHGVGHDHAVIAHGASHEFEQQAVVGVHGEGDGAHGQEVESVRADDAGQ